MAKIIMTKPSESGIALGGIGAGSVEIMPDGEFHYWQIANPPRLTRACWGDKVDDGESHTGALSFYVRTEQPGRRPVVRKLGMRTDPEDFTYRLYPWNKPVERITFDGRFPVCELKYEDGDLPCLVTGKAVAPFVPHHTDIAATPGFYMDFEIENTKAFCADGEPAGHARPRILQRRRLPECSVQRLGQRQYHDASASENRCAKLRRSVCKYRRRRR
ncbi:MAG: hypothetical protein K5784_10075 [Clostridiales bacterium]|nr:hypothetical protein [Clostridiales bacterium]